MGSRQRIVLWVVSVAFLAVVLTVLFYRFGHRKPISLAGAVTVQDVDPRKELPIADVEISTAEGLTNTTAKSDATGFFSLKLPPWIRRGHAITLQFRHADYRPLDLKEFVGDKLYIAHMVPIMKNPLDDDNQPVIQIANLRVRYSIKTLQPVNIGTAVKTFQIENKGSVPCKNGLPCSPDGKWKAGIGAATLDAGPGNEFRNTRVSCISGPCPFTKIETDGFSAGGQNISVSARGWSDTTTFLVEAEVFHPLPSEAVHESYPVIFGRALNFTLPSSAEGVSIEADLSGETIVFPLGPALRLSWAECNARVNRDQTRVYRCELKPGYRF